MKLITEHGQLPLPDDLEIAVEQHNPFSRTRELRLSP